MDTWSERKKRNKLFKSKDALSAVFEDDEGMEVPSFLPSLSPQFWRRCPLSSRCLGLWSQQSETLAVLLLLLDMLLFEGAGLGLPTWVFALLKENMSF